MAAATVDGASTMAIRRYSTQQQQPQSQPKQQLGTPLHLLAGGIAGAVSKTCTAALARLTILCVLKSRVASLSSSVLRSRTDAAADRQLGGEALGKLENRWASWRIGDDKALGFSLENWVPLGEQEHEGREALGEQDHAAAASSAKMRRCCGRRSVAAVVVAIFCCLKHQDEEVLGLAICCRLGGEKLGEGGVVAGPSSNR